MYGSAKKYYIIKSNDVRFTLGICKLDLLNICLKFVIKKIVKLLINKHKKEHTLFTLFTLVIIYLFFNFFTILQIPNFISDGKKYENKFELNIN